MKLITAEKKCSNLIERTLGTARIYIKNVSAENNDNDIILNYSKKYDCVVNTPEWFHKNGIGYVITSSEDQVDLEVTCLNKGILTLVLRSVDIRNNNQKIEYFIDFKKLAINNQEIFNFIIPCSHDKPFRYTMPVQKDQKLKIRLEWEMHNYESTETFKVISAIAESFLKK